MNPALRSCVVPHATLLYHVTLCPENVSFGGREPHCCNNTICLINDVRYLLLLCNSSMSTVCSMGILEMFTDGYFPILCSFLRASGLAIPKGTAKDHTIAWAVWCHWSLSHSVCLLWPFLFQWSSDKNGNLVFCTYGLVCVLNRGHSVLNVYLALSLHWKKLIFNVNIKIWSPHLPEIPICNLRWHPCTCRIISSSTWEKPNIWGSRGCWVALGEMIHYAFVMHYADVVTYTLSKLLFLFI